MIWRRNSPKWSFDATDGNKDAAHFTGQRLHRQIPDTGHNLPQEAPVAFVTAIQDVCRLAAGERTH